jgi:uncharacterized protein
MISLQAAAAPHALQANPAHLILAHGAGAPMTSAFMEQLAEALAGAGVATTRFEFDYMAERRITGTKRPPPSIAKLVEEYRAVVASLAAVTGRRLFIGGKSMGGRVASLVADELYQQGRIAGLVCVVYPFHPPRQPSKLRTEHLRALSCPTLIIQGTRDPLGAQAEVATYALAPTIELRWLNDGDHDLMPRTQMHHIATAAAAVARFVGSGS